jgi:hypothetical protein
MNTESLALFFHICGALGMASAIALEALGLQQVQRATMPSQAGAGLRIMGGTRRLGFPSMLAAILTGIYMMATDGGPTPWLYTTMGALVVLIVLSVVNGPRMAAMGQVLAHETAPLSATFHNIVNYPLISISLYTRIAIILGIVFLKTAKPGWAGSLVTIGVAIVLGAVSAVSVSRRVQAPAEASS